MSVDDDLKRIADLQDQARSLNELIEKARQLRAQIETQLQTLRASSRPVRKPVSERRAGVPDRRRATRRDRRTRR